MQSYDVAEWGQPLQKRLRDTPQPGPDEVLVRLTHCGVCHSDVHIREGWFDLGGGNKLKLSERGTQLPLTLGARADRHRAGRRRQGYRYRAGAARAGQPVDRLRPVLGLQQRPRQPVQQHARDGCRHPGRLCHAPAGAAPAVTARCRGPGPGPRCGAGLLRRHRLLGGAEVRHARGRRLGGRARLRRRGPDGAVGAGRDGPPARHCL